MSRRAHVDIAVPREELAQPGRKAQIRIALRDRLAELGRIESIERYVMDPPDGPFRDGTFGVFDWDRFALIRVIGFVRPNAPQGH
jgi:hypothetical protein